MCINIDGHGIMLREISQKDEYMWSLKGNKLVNIIIIKKRFTENKLVVTSGERREGQYMGSGVGDKKYWM